MIPTEPMIAQKIRAEEIILISSNKFSFAFKKKIIFKVKFQNIFSPNTAMVTSKRIDHLLRLL